MMRYLPVLTDRHGVFAWQAFIGWWADLRDETEYMPNTSFRELDFIEEADLYQECKSDLLESGTHHSMVGSLQLWKKVWKGHFGDVKIRKHRRVDGKDRKRAFLRYLLRRKVTRSRRDRLLIKELRSIYRDTCRRERTFYWVARILPGKNPENYATYISDGATQSDYSLPKIPGFSLGREVGFKLVGNLWHGHCLHFHLVMPNVKDDANLVCHCLDSSREVFAQVRADKGQDHFFPPNFRIQLDGVNTNWGEVTFAHVENMHNQRAFGAQTDVRRNKVGSTHEDVDGLFSVIKAHVKNKEIITPQDLIAAIKNAFATYSLPVFVSIVDATFDYKAHYAGHVDKKLGGYGYSQLTDGYHCLTFDESKALSPTGVAFKKYQQDNFVDIALQRKDLPPDLRPEDDDDFTMCPMIVENGWEAATILLTSPSGKPSNVATGAENFSWEAALNDVEQVMVQGKMLAPQMAQWREFVDARPKNHEDMKTVATLPTWDFTPRPGGAATQLPESSQEIARRAVLASAVRTRAPLNISSSVASGAEGAEDRRKRRGDIAMRQRDQKLENGEFVFYKATYECCEDEKCGGCHIPLLLGQLFGDLSELDTLDPDTRVDVKCWEPKGACYDGDWKKWLDARRKQHLVTLEVAKLALTGVKFTTAKEKKGGLWQVSAAIKTQLRQHRQSNYAKFGAKPTTKGKAKKRAVAEPESESDEEGSDVDGGAVAAPQLDGGGVGGPAPQSPVPQSPCV